MAKKLNKIDSEGETLLASDNIDLNDLDLTSLVEEVPIFEQQEKESVNNISESMEIIISLHKKNKKHKNIVKNITGTLDTFSPLHMSTEHIKDKQGLTVNHQKVIDINLWLPKKYAYELFFQQDYDHINLSILSFDGNVTEFKSEKQWIVEQFNINRKEVSGMLLCNLILSS